MIQNKTAGRGDGFYPEIQGLRGLAVALVVLFHVWPGFITGGYVGVDVFFVISGYLITGSLLRSLLRDGRISLADFYVRRARRLLPAATLVLVLTAVGTLMFLPADRWEETAKHIAASALNVENWFLAYLQTDYLGSEDAASPVQHFWSLAVEEQFYIVWPLLLILAADVARRLRLSAALCCFIALVLVFSISLIISIVITGSGGSETYFLTQSRAFELALGGLLAFAVPRFRAPNRVRSCLSAVGIAMVVVAAFVFSSKTDFPGSAALLPTVGAALIILAGDVRYKMLQGLNYRPLRYLGDISYSLYLWHWPILVFMFDKNGELGAMQSILALALTLVVAHLSYVFVEERFRHLRFADFRRPLRLAGGAIVFSLFAALTVKGVAFTQTLGYGDTGDRQYPGPLVLTRDVDAPDGVRLLPPLAMLKKDIPVVYQKDCHADADSTKADFCVFGNKKSKKVVAVVGDSHAAQWVPALSRIADKRGWRLLAMTKSACPFADVSVRDAHGDIDRDCVKWRKNALKVLGKQDVDMVITSQYEEKYDDVPAGKMIEGLRDMWHDLHKKGVRVVAISDTPDLPFNPGDCLSDDPEECEVPRKKADTGNQLEKAAKGMSGVSLVDLNDGVCAKDECKAVVGNVIVWRDRHHLSATYVGKMTDYVSEHIDF